MPFAELSEYFLHYDCTTSFPGSLLFTPQEAREGRPWERGLRLYSVKEINRSSKEDFGKRLEITLLSRLNERVLKIRSNAKLNTCPQIGKYFIENPDESFLLVGLYLVKFLFSI